MKKTLKGQDATTGKAVVIETVKTKMVSEKVLAGHLATILTRSKKEDKQVEADTRSIAQDSLAYLQELQDNAGSFGVQLSPEALQDHVFVLANYNPKDADKTKRSTAFQMRVTRGTRRAAIAHKASLPDYDGKPYALSVTGELQLPNNVLVRRIKQDVEGGGKIEVDNQDTTLTNIPEKAIGSHMNSVFPGSVSQRPGAVKSGQGKSTDATSALDGYETLIDSVNGVNSGKPMTGFADLDRSAIRKLIKITQTAKNIHNIALTNDCDGAMQYLMQLLDNSKDESAVA